MDDQNLLLNLTNKLSALRASLDEGEKNLLDQLLLQDDDEDDVQAHGAGGRLPLILLEEGQYIPGGGGRVPGGGGYTPGGGGLDKSLEE